MEMEKVKEQDLEKQIGGCMAGFFNIFDRPNLLSPNKRLSSSPSAESESASGRSSPLNSRRNQQSVYSTPELRSDSLNLTTLPPVIVLELNFYTSGSGHLSGDLSGDDGHRNDRIMDSLDSL